MNILVTGGKGFLGSSIVHRLLELGHKVETLSRSADSEKNSDVKHHQLDLSKKVLNFKQFEGIECIFHTAAKAGIDGRYNDYYTANYLGTKNILRLAKDIGVKYFIYTSSPSVVFSGKPISGGNEKLSYVSNRVSPYSHTKALAEEAVLHANNNNTLLSTSLRPHLIWGENDPHLLPKVIARHKKRKT